MANPPKLFNADTGFITVTRQFCKQISCLTVLIGACFSTFNVYSAEIIVTIPPLAGLVKMIAPNKNVDCLLTSKSDPHHFQLSPRQVEMLTQAKVLVRSSKDDHGWMKLTADIPSIDLGSEQDHAWLNPVYVQKILPKLAQKLVVTFPDEKEDIHTRLGIAQEKVAALNHNLNQALQHLNTTGVIMQHPSWHGVFNQYNIPVLLTLESLHHGYEQGPHHLEKALKTLHQHSHAVLVGDLQHGNRALQWLSKHHNGAKVLYLDTLGSCGDDWVRLMQRNIMFIRNQ